MLVVYDVVILYVYMLRTALLVILWFIFCIAVFVVAVKIGTKPIYSSLGIHAEVISIKITLF